MRNRFYMVTFQQHIHCTIRDFVYICEAPNAKEAKAKAKQEWSASRNSFMFHLDVKWLKGDVLPDVTDYKNLTYTPAMVCGRFICTNILIWRVDGKNLF